MYKKQTEKLQERLSHIISELNFGVVCGLIDTALHIAVTKMHITIINILVYYQIAIAIIIIITMITIFITVITIRIIISNSLNPHRGYVKSNNFLPQFLPHMTSDVKLMHAFFIYIFFVQKLQLAMN